VISELLLYDPVTRRCVDWQRMWAKHFFARVLCLIILPVGFYMAMFGIHFLCLVNPGEGDGFMSSEVTSPSVSHVLTIVPTKSQ